jgi:hypothetical protein
MSEPSRRRQGVTVHLGKTKVTKLGVARYNWHDAYHLIMSLTWPKFFAGALTIYLVVNLVFESAYFLGNHPIENATSFTDCFFFSVETLATVGYGTMSPATFYGHCVATAEIVTGMMSMAVITSLVFARFSKPTARILFSRVDASIARSLPADKGSLLQWRFEIGSLHTPTRASDRLPPGITHRWSIENISSASFGI